MRVIAADNNAFNTTALADELTRIRPCHHFLRFFGLLTIAPSSRYIAFNTMHIFCYTLEVPRKTGGFDFEFIGCVRATDENEANKKMVAKHGIFPPAHPAIVVQQFRDEASVEECEFYIRMRH